MRKLQTREDRKNTALAVSSSPSGLLTPLNRVPQSKRARELVELVQTLQAIEHREAVLNEVERQLSEIPNYESSGLVRAPSHMYAEANEILSACHWSPRITPPPHEPNTFTWNARTIKSDWENCFVNWALNLRASGDISLIRSCRNCRKWFYAITNHQAFCRGRCRQQHHSKDKSFKDQRRLYMRRYRSKEEARKLAEELIRKSRRPRN
jgi:hypothetical protein